VTAPIARRPARLAVCASGQGSNLQALLDACATGQLPAAVVLVAVDRAGAPAIARAEAAQVPLWVEPLADWLASGRSRAAYEVELQRVLVAAEVDLVVLAGWRQVLSAAFLEPFAGRILNLHPALPGELPGLHAIARAHAEAQRGLRSHSGVMVHHAIAEVDAGPVVMVEQVAIDPREPLEAFTARMHAIEHRVLVQALHMWLASV
jgi:phosphoribosylglycinamide formyltransferase-1